MRFIRISLLLLSISLVTSCKDDSIEGKLKDVMSDYVATVNNEDVDAMLDLVYPPIFDSIPKREIAANFVNYRRGRRIILKEVLKVYGPYEHNGTQYALADFRFGKGVVFFKRRDVIPYAFASDDGENWHIIPFPMSVIMETDKIGRIRLERIYGYYDYSYIQVLPEAIIEQMINDYIPGSED